MKVIITAIAIKTIQPLPLEELLLVDLFELLGYDDREL